MMLLMSGMSPDTIEVSLAHLAPSDLDELLEESCTHI